MKKSIAILLCAILLVSLFSACSAKPAEAEQPEAATTPAAESQPQQEQAEEPAAASTEKTVITFWNGFTGTDGDVLKEIVAEYNATNTLNVEIQVEIMSWDSLYQKLATALPVGEGPDIIAYNTEYIASYAESGALAVINDLYETGGMDAKAIPAAMEENLKYNGEYYGVPCNMATLLLYYNKDLFAAAGLDPEAPPTTWDELESAALALTKEVDGEQQYGFGMATNNTIQMWPIMIWAGGGDFIGEDGKSVFNSKENVDTITRWSKLIKEDGIAPAVMTGADIDNLFAAGKLGMYFCGPWATGTFDAAGINYGLAACPAGPAGPATLGTGVAMVMTADSKNKDGVYDFFKYWNSTEAQVKWSLDVGYPLTNTTVSSDSRLAANPNIAAFSDAGEYAHFYLQQLTCFSEIDADIITPAIEEILLTDADVQEVLDRAAEQMDALTGN